MRISVSLICLLIFSKPVRGQVLNAEAFKSQEAITDSLRGQFSFGFTVDKQRSIVYSAYTDADLSFKIGSNSLLTAARLRVTGTSEQTLLNGGFAHLRFRDNTGKAMLLEYYSQYQWDGVRGLKHRYILGSNIRQLVFKDSLGHLYAGFGIFYEFENWGMAAVDIANQPPGMEEVSKHLLKFNTYLRFSQKIGQSARFSTVFYYQAVPEYFFTNYRLAGTLQWSFRVNRNLDFSLNYDGIYDTSPVVPIDHFYFNISNQFVWKF